MNPAKTAFVLSLATVAGAASAQNLVANPSFETLGPGIILYQNWEPPFGSVFNDPSVDIAARTGTNSVKMYGTFPGPGVQGDSGMFQSNIPIVGGQAYTYGASVYTPAADAIGDGNIAFIFAQWFDAGGAQLRQDQIVLAEVGAPADQWVDKAATVTAPANAETAAIFLLHIQLNNAGGAVFIDDVFLEEGSLPEPCMVDLNNDSQLNIDDVLLFLQLFAQGCDF